MGAEHEFELVVREAGLEREMFGLLLSSLAVNEPRSGPVGEWGRGILC